MPGAIRGVIEGFYGPPWSWEERRLVASWCADRGLRTAVWAPKLDPLHKAAWRDPWSPAHLEGFERLAALPGVELGVALAPGFVDPSSSGDRAALEAKVEGALEAGATTIVLAYDDIALSTPVGLGSSQAEITSWIFGRIGGRATLALVPTEYVGERSTPYLDELARGLPTEVPVGWTGPAVVNDVLGADDAERRAAALGGRAPLLWDNWPVNDWVMEDRLFLGPLRGRAPDLLEACSGYLANPMRQPRCSLLPLASTAAWARGDDPEAAWAAEADRLGLRVLAEACDATVPRRLVDDLDLEGSGPSWAGAAARLRAWLEAATSCEAPGLEGEADDWVVQVRAEAEVGLVALRTYSATKPRGTLGTDGAGGASPWGDDALLGAVMELMGRWPKVRRSGVSVFGPRCSFRPVLGQREDGAWQYRSPSLEEDDNALDTLARLALDEAAQAGAPGPLSVHADGVAVAVAADGSFRVEPGALVVARCGRGATKLRPDDGT